MTKTDAQEEEPQEIRPGARYALGIGIISRGSQ